MAPQMCKLCSYNARGLPKDNSGLLLRPDILDLLTSSDILCIQETWYTKQDLGGLNGLHSDFHGHGISTVDTRDGLISGHAPGGVAILWHKSLDHFISPVDINCDFAVAVKVKLGSKTFIVVNIYMPHQSANNEHRYAECLGALEAVISDIDNTCFVLMGDWNSNPGDANSLFGRPMSVFCGENDLTVSSKVYLPDDTYTYISCAWDTHSWLDHVVSSSDFHCIIDKMQVLYDISVEDHIPVMTWINAERIPNISPQTNESIIQNHHWKNVTDVECEQYAEVTDQLLSGISIDEKIFCTEVNCTDLSHIAAANSLYGTIVECLKQADTQVFPTSKLRTKYNKPGWSDYVKDLYQSSRQTYKLWATAGKPRQGQLFEAHRHAKGKYKYARRFIQRNENDLRKEALANKLCSLDHRDFWREIRHMNNCNTPLPTCIDDATGEKEVSELWKSHFEKLFNCVAPRNFPNCLTDNYSSYNDIAVTVEELRSAIKDLDNGKACGLDGICAEHLKFASCRILALLSICITSLFIHGALPASLIDIVLVPVIKNKSGSITSKDNYRPIALAGAMSKVIEIIILNRIEDLLVTSPNQFGFKRKHGTDQCIYALKECIDSYRALNSSVFTCFLDASKAFDRVNHSVLFHKLVRRGLPMYIIRILMYWYVNQRVCVRWGSCFSDFFHVRNGVRQGGILSPLLFNVYNDDLSKALNSHKVGCSYSGITVNHLMYADDIVLLAPSLSGLQKLITECELYGTLHDIKFNAEKTALLYFKSDLLRRVDLPTLQLGGLDLKITHSVKYLGHSLTSDLKDDDDIARQCRVLYAQGNILLRKFFMCTLDVKLKMFKTYCTPLYTAHLWFNYKKTSLNKLYIAYHNIFKLLLNFSKYESTSLLCTVFDVPCCAAVIRKFIFRFCRRLEQTSNSIVMSLLADGIYFSSRIRKHWMCLLLVNFT